MTLLKNSNYRRRTKMKRNKLVLRLISMVLSLAILGVMIAGCGGTVPQSSDATPTHKASDAKTDKVEVEFFQQKPEVVDIFNSIISEFEKANPNIKITQNNIPNSRDVLMTRMAAGDVPELFSAYPNAPEFKTYQKEGYLYDLTGKDCLKNVDSVILDSVKIDGKDYALPLSKNTTGVFYNINMFEKLGIEIPKTYADFVAACEKIKDSGITPIAFGDKDYWIVGVHATMITGEEMGGDASAKFFEDVTNGSTSFAEDPAFAVVANRLLEMRKYAQPDSNGTGVADALNLFANEKTAMFIDGIWDIPAVIKANPNLEFSLFPLPATKAEDTKVVYGIDAAFSMSADAENPEKALKFLEYLSSTEAAQFFSDKDGSPSCIKGVQVKTEKIKLLTDLLNNGKAFQWIHFNWATGMEAKWQQAAQAYVMKKDINSYYKELDKIFTEDNRQ